MLNVTFDMTCIIDLEKNNDTTPYLRKLIRMHEDREINLRVVAISASERKPDHTYASHFDEFKKRIAVVGLADVEILTPISYWGITFWDYSLWNGKTQEELERKIQGILFPTIELRYVDFCRKRGLDSDDKKAWRRWVNRKCDVLALWSHLWHDGDVFVTRDEHFHQKTKKARLIALGAGEILKPAEAVKLLANRPHASVHQRKVRN
jgi:hypothetical protein